MAKRKRRILINQLQETNEYLSFILKNKAVYLGKVLAIESATIKIKNTKGHVLHLPFARIEEIWMEEKVV